MREGELLRHIYARSAGLAGIPQVAVGPGDDCAVVRAGGGDVLLKVDQVVAGRHFRPPPGTPIDLIARKAVGRAVSDIAAMAGTPVCSLAGAVLPPGAAWADELFDAMSVWAGRWGCPLVGGDICISEEPSPSPHGPGGLPVLGVTIMGTPHPARGPVLRSGARPGDGVYVTGLLGATLDPRTGLGHHLAFEPRLAEAMALADGLGAGLHAMMDISDGLGLDASRLAAASGVRIELDAGAFPLREGADWRGAAGDGEDYELLFTTDAGEIPIPAWRVGVVARGSGCTIRGPGGEVADAGAFGWEHGR
ncbi:MAG: thiamine-monophosphate kinase [Phycisphaerales bacterium]|nr:thiamine-monophosphate kinase [Phycisphaerales bacterium]